MHEFLMFGSIEERLVFTAAQLVILAVTLFYNYRRKTLEKEQKELRKLVIIVEMFLKHRQKQ